MDFYSVLDARKSIRAYLPRPVEPAKLDRILRAAVGAPTAGNLQAFDLLVVEEARRREEIARACVRQTFIAQAPVVLVFSANLDRSAAKYGEAGRRLFAIQDATIATTLAHLAAAAEGLASCWIGAFDPAVVSKICRLPPDRAPVAVLPVGYAAEKAETTPRRSLEEAVTWDREP
jgi:nitroreductase